MDQTINTPTQHPLKNMKTNTRHICLLLLTTALLSSGCRTFRGFGQDVQHAGNHIERAANH